MEQYKNKIRKVPCYICCVCNRLLYKRSVHIFGKKTIRVKILQNVAMSLCTLIYSKIRWITSVHDIIQIMTVGKQLYSSLLLLARQSMLMLTELPEMVTVFERFFRLEYSESYTCNMHGDARIEGYLYCMPLETLLALKYNSFIHIGVDSHARDMYGNRVVTVIVKVHVYCWKYHPCIN